MMSAEYVRLCPTCGLENAPAVMRCECGALLAGIDLTARVALNAARTDTPPATPATAAAPAGTDAGPKHCPHADCAQPNPPDASRCVYCDRPLDSTGEGLSGERAGIPSLISLPGTLRERFHILRALPATGAEAELLIVQASGESDAPERVAKIYRNGIHPDQEISARIARIDPAHRVNILESGLADGFTFELMEYCRAGSLRDLLKRRRLDADRLHDLIAELTTAIAAVHQAGLIHRDLKPENILVREETPLDLVLTDFSIASLQNATLRFTGTARTLAYGAPETLSGVINQKADWWSLGMMLLEIASGTHPFAGLSDAVILHRLTTRSIDLSAVDTPELRKLLRGLLLRDPKQRWGEAEVRRWLAADPDLPEPAHEGREASAVRPYRIGDESCTTPEQLATALARHWDKALSDLDNGLLMQWLRDDLQDQNRVRFLIELNLQGDLHVDLRLLRLLLDLAPGLPPVWRGENLTLRCLLHYADRALKNDSDAAAWLHTLFTFKVLAIYTAAGNQEAAEMARRWEEALTQFNTAWETAMAQIRAAGKAQPDEVTLYDDVVYGRGGPLRPSPQQLHARLLAVSYDPAWSQRLRQHLQGEVARLSLLAPWLNAVGDIGQLDPAGLLALESLLPEARKQAKRLQERENQDRARATALTEQLNIDSVLAIADIAQDAGRTFFGDAICRGQLEKIERFDRLIAQVRAQGGSDAAYIELRKKVTRIEPAINRLQRLLEALLERRAVNRGWLDQRTLGFFFGGLLFLPLFNAERLLYPLLLLGLIFIAWRLLPNFFSVRQIKVLLGKIGQGG